MTSSREGCARQEQGGLKGGGGWTGKPAGDLPSISSHRENPIAQLTTREWIRVDLNRSTCRTVVTGNWFTLGTNYLLVYIAIKSGQSIIVKFTFVFNFRHKTLKWRLIIICRDVFFSLCWLLTGDTDINVIGITILWYCYCCCQLVRPPKRYYQSKQYMSLVGNVDIQRNKEYDCVTDEPYEAWLR